MKKHLLWVSICVFSLGLLLTSTITASVPAAMGGEGKVSVVYVQIDAGISPAQVDLVDQALDSAVEKGAGMLLIRLDTPGGLVESMRQIVQSILNSPIPVAVWVGPSGARAASAGVFIVAAADIAAMSPQSTIGAASPVMAGGKDMDKTMAHKVKNDLLSLVRSVAKSRGRNVEWFEDSVDKAVSITAEEAVMQRVVEYIAPNVDDLLVQIGAQGGMQKGVSLAFDSDGYEIIQYEPGVRYKLLSWLIDPQIAYFLLLGGMAGLFFELTTPGAILPGVIGGFCLLLGLYAMSVLPTSATGLLLILFGLVLFLLEIKVVSYGMLSIAAIVSLFMGSLILFKDQSGVQTLPLSTIIATVLGVSLLCLAAVYLAAKAQLAPRYSGNSAMVGLTGTIKSIENGKGKLLVRGELWNFTLVEGLNAAVGDEVQIVEVNGLQLIADKAEVKS